MMCATCSSDTQVKRSKVTDAGSSVTRQRCCPKGHRFDTVERRRAHGLGEVLVRRSGDQKLADGTFDLNRLHGDVRNGVLKRLSDTEVLDAVNAAVGLLETRLPELVTPLTEEERSARPGFAGAINDTDITDAVEQTLRHSPSRMAHVLYALYVRGRSDREGRKGWGEAVDVLRWLVEPHNYPNLVITEPQRPEIGVQVWQPTAMPPMPETVVKRKVANEQQRHGRFVRRQLVESIRQAMLGRPGNPLGTSERIAQWVLWGIAGQQEVHTSQLAVGVLDCLRRVDDIAYLRWASIAKNVESVTTFRNEVVSLITHPSPRLVIDEPGLPRPPMDPTIGLPLSNTNAS